MPKAARSYGGDAIDPDLRFDAADFDIFAGKAPFREASQTGDQLIVRCSAHIDIVSPAATVRF